MNYPLRLIEWHDAFNSNHSWFDADTIPADIKPLVTHTIGFEVQRTKTHVTLAMSMTDQGRLCDLFTIPVAMIAREQTFRRRLK